MIIVSGMLLITAFTTRFNKTFETKWEYWITFWLTIWVLFVISSFSDLYPVNLILVGLLSGLIWWQIWPALSSYQKYAKLKEFAEINHISYSKKDWIILDEQQAQDFQQYLIDHPESTQWNKVVSQTIFACVTTLCIAAGIVWFTDIDFWFLQYFLLIALIMLIVVWLLNVFIFKSRIISVIKSYCWVLVFTGYLLYDFNQLEQFASDQSRSTAIHMSVSVYLDIINLFMYLLDILSD